MCMLEQTPSSAEETTKTSSKGPALAQKNSQGSFSQAQSLPANLGQVLCKTSGHTKMLPFVKFGEKVVQMNELCKAKSYM